MLNFFFFFPHQSPLRQRIRSTELVPGDVVEVDDRMVFPCDMVVCTGAVIVNEAMLTGEALPRTLTPNP